MPRVLLTAFEPYDRWKDNASWQALVELTNWYDGPAQLVTRRYPVDLSEMSHRLREDLHQGFDLAIHLGQAPGSAVVRLESVGLNLRSDGTPLIPNAPEAYRTALPLDAVAESLNAAGIPGRVSHHAGTFLCNAALYLSQHYGQSFGMSTQSVFVHLPLTPAQVAADSQDFASMSSQLSAAAIAMTIARLTERVA
ncbi:pyroglutamyl-peptidase I [Crateriforma conspicua]|uniref:Pyrrolidone-carboxylate peptidase n=1 Tax=Crateriforma conspicua TaxID=2527996 RepID=A0A5C6FKY1_9PLAN|nr:pyroglutamyl-peptidase I [Crateriforma conspicua]TWU61792.1 Pyrrolidone-carboxylate peptidase [Crateriforma conspicua]